MIVLILLLFTCLEIKNDASNLFRMLVTEIENWFSKKVKRLCSDKGTKYDSALPLMSSTTQKE